MATRTINGREYTKAHFENKLRHLGDAQELAAMLNELKLPWFYSDLSLLCFSCETTKFFS